MSNADIMLEDGYAGAELLGIAPIFGSRKFVIGLGIVAHWACMNSPDPADYFSQSWSVALDVGADRQEAIRSSILLAWQIRFMPREICSGLSTVVERPDWVSYTDDVAQVLCEFSNISPKNASLYGELLTGRLFAAFHGAVQQPESGHMMNTTASKYCDCRVLFLAANPRETERLQIDEEIRSVQNKINLSDNSARIDMRIGLALRPDDLLEHLNRVDPHILHFSGHGSTGGICLCDDEGKDVRELSDLAIDRLFLAMKGNIRLVVLNACYSNSQAAKINNHVDCVVGMKSSISDNAAIKFAAALYLALSFGKSVRNAFDQAIAAVALAGFDEDDVPELLVKKGVDATRVTLLGD